MHVIRNLLAFVHQRELRMMLVYGFFGKRDLRGKPPNVFFWVETSARVRTPPLSELCYILVLILPDLGWKLLFQWLASAFHQKELPLLFAKLCVASRA
jgi:hypothetical protein